MMHCHNKSTGSNNITETSNKIPSLPSFPPPPHDCNIFNDIRDGMKQVQGTGDDPTPRAKILSEAKVIIYTVVSYSCL